MHEWTVWGNMPHICQTTVSVRAQFSIPNKLNFSTLFNPFACCYLVAKHWILAHWHNFNSLSNFIAFFSSSYARSFFQQKSFFLSLVLRCTNIRPLFKQQRHNRFVLALLAPFFPTILQIYDYEYFFLLLGTIWMLLNHTSKLAIWEQFHIKTKAKMWNFNLENSLDV